MPAASTPTAGAAVLAVGSPAVAEEEIDDPGAAEAPVDAGAKAAGAAGEALGFVGGVVVLAGGAFTGVVGVLVGGQSTTPVPTAWAPLPPTTVAVVVSLVPHATAGPPSPPPAVNAM